MNIKPDYIKLINFKGEGWCTQGHEGPVGLAKCPAGKPATNGL